MAFAMPLVVPKTRRTVIGGQSFVRPPPLGRELSIQSKADLHAMLVGIATDDTKQQESLGNPPQIVTVDDKTNKPFQEATRKIVVLFGTVLARAAMAMVENELRQAITRSTRSVSGALANIGSSWQWRFIPRGGAARTVSAANPVTTFQRGDKLVLVPVAVPYATAVNRAVANAGKLNKFTATKASKTGRKRHGSQARSTQNLGFLAVATAAVRRRAEFKAFSVMAEFTTAHAVPGEVYAFTRGGPRATGVITIRPRFRYVKV